MQQIVAFLDEDGNGFMDPGEVKVLISKLTGLRIDEIPDDHPEVTMLSNITAPQLVDKLWRNTAPQALHQFENDCSIPADPDLPKNPQLIDKFYTVLGLHQRQQESPESVLLINTEGGPEFEGKGLVPGYGEVMEEPDSPASPGSPMEAVSMSMF